MEPAPGSAPPAVSLRGVSRRFGRVRALEDARLEVAAGEVHGLLGENGAGKSTLLGVLGGLVRPDAGTVELEGRAFRPRGPRAAAAAGVALVHQHFALVPAFTVLENLALPSAGGAASLRRPLPRLRARARALAEATGLGVDLDAPVEALGVGERQRAEILKALLLDPRVLALDEPTAVLAPAEVEGLLALLRRLAAEGRAVVLVAHKLDEVLAVADRVTVLRGGRTVLEASRSEVDAAGLARVMVGEALAREAAEAVGLREADAGGPGSSPAAGETVAVLRDVARAGREGAHALRGVSLEVRRGEIVGVAGVEGNGQRELARVLAGRSEPDAGEAELPPDPAFIPEDRTFEGLVADFDAASNLALALARDPAFRAGPFVRWRTLRRRAAELTEAFGVRGAAPGAPVRELSGGNQQRVVVARELSRDADLVVAENPVRGLDVAGTAFVHATLRGLRERPRPPGVVLVSTDLDEVLALADRVFVMVRGRLVGVPDDRRTRAGLGALMLGGAGTPP